MAAEQRQNLEVLSARIAASRVAVASELANLRYRLDVPSRVKESVLSKPLAWLGGSLGAGFVASIFLKRRHRRPRTEKAEKSAKKAWWSVLLGGAFTLARPALQNWALREFQARFAQPKYPQDKHP
jgi:hypothetical protein